ncbi:hypothetical protein G6L99_29790 [Agrobacterium rhizogenes]|uniref:hypothetical protein n=1 Tax=Rhizobium rhizogenes TaxID=359 RepID=UPI00056975E1|nr:hypothetical protein [Rhizobium rhizogenes]NTH16330.1 hypothetical protein [Rhizobium rhizogenes]NTI78087.1 hypothetical protein [Rhizobium rhizogenes]
MRGWAIIAIIVLTAPFALFSWKVTAASIAKLRDLGSHIGVFDGTMNGVRFNFRAEGALSITLAEPDQTVSIGTSSDQNSKALEKYFSRYEQVASLPLEYVSFDIPIDCNAIARGKPWCQFVGVGDGKSLHIYNVRLSIPGKLNKKLSNFSQDNNDQAWLNPIDGGAITRRGNKIQELRQAEFLKCLPEGRVCSYNFLIDNAFLASIDLYRRNENPKDLEDFKSFSADIIEFYLN